MFVLLSLVTELALSVRNVLPSQLGLRILRGILLLWFQSALLRCSMGRSFSCIVGTRWSRRGSSGEFRFFIRTGRSFQTLRYDAATAVCAATADDADAEAQAASTRTVETEEGFSFDVAFWEGAIRSGGAEIIWGELSRTEPQCVLPVVFCFRPAPSWDCRGKEYSEQAAATACLLTVAVTHRRAVWARFAEAFATSIQTASQPNPRGFFSL